MYIYLVGAITYVWIIYSFSKAGKFLLKNKTGLSENYLLFTQHIFVELIYLVNELSTN